MALKAVLETLDDVPEALQSEYKQQGEVYVLAIEGIDDHPSVKNLKSAHERTKADHKKTKEVLTEATEKLEAFGELTVEELEELREKAENAGKGGKAPTKEEIDAMVAERYKIDRAKIEKQLEVTTTERDDFKTKFEATTTSLSQERIFNKIKDAALKAGVRSKALSIVTDMAKNVWKLDDNGEPVAYKGDDPLMGATGPVTMDDWVGSLKDEHDYLFEPNKGGGAQGGDGKTNGQGKTVVDLSQPNAIGKNLDAFKKGDVQVRSN